MHTFIDHSRASQQSTRWRTLAVFAHTFSCSSRVVVRSGMGRLTPDAIDSVVDRWCKHVFRLSKTTLTATGLDRFDPGQPYVLLSNHRSLLDIPAVCVTYPGRVRFVAKAELRKVPMFGRAMAASGIVFVDRDDRAKAIASLSQAGSLADAGSSLWIAAEGGRSKGDGVGTLKKGPFHVALQRSLPILPTWITGTQSVLPAGSLTSVTGQHVHVAYGDPISTEGLTVTDLPSLIERAHQALEGLASVPQ